MIIEIKIANFRSINAEQTFSFVAENARRHEGNLIPRKGYKLLKAAALFGANASGKSNLVKAIGAMRDFVQNSATRMNDGDVITAAEPFRLDPDTRCAPSRFEMTFVVDDMLYIYGFAADTDRVQREYLKAQPEEGRVETFGFERNFDSKTNNYIYDWSGTLKPVADLLRDRTRPNALTLSTGARENVSQLLLPYRFFRDRIGVLNMSGEIDLLAMQTANYADKDAQLYLQLSALLCDADTGIESFHVERRPLHVDSILRADVAEDIKIAQTMLRELAASTSIPRIVTSRRENKGEVIHFDFHKEESDGTQRFLAIAGPLLFALRQGEFAVVDELDASMHPLLTRKLLELFQSTDANQNGAQMLFTTHDPSLLDQELFRRDQVWLAEKRDHASTFFSLADVEPRPRNTEAFLRNYLAGRYGGTPHLGRAFDTLKAGEAK